MRILGKPTRAVEIDGRENATLRFGFLLLAVDVDAFPGPDTGVSIWLGSFDVGCSAIRIAVDAGYKTEEEADQWFRSNLALMRAGLMEASNLIWDIDT